MNNVSSAAVSQDQNYESRVQKWKVQFSIFNCTTLPLPSIGGSSKKKLVLFQIAYGIWLCLCILYSRWLYLPVFHSLVVAAYCVVTVESRFYYALPLVLNQRIWSHVSYSVLSEQQCAGPEILAHTVELHLSSCGHFAPLWCSLVYHFGRGVLPLWHTGCGCCTFLNSSLITYFLTEVWNTILPNLLWSVPWAVIICNL